jgi:HEAT repeat protein
MNFRARRTGSTQRSSHFKLSSLTLLILGLALALSSQVRAVNAPAASPAGDSAAVATASIEQIAQLVSQLGSASFAERERATRRLVELGVAGRAALVEACMSADAEVRVRARAVLAAVSEADFRDRLEAFLSDYDGTRKQTLPGWEQFVSMFGSGRQARQIFVEMQRAEPELMEAFSKDAKTASKAVVARSQSISQQAMQSPREGLISMGTVASMLLVGGSQDVSIDEQLGVQVYAWMIYQPVFQKNAASGVWSPMLKKLLGRWVVKDASPTATVQNLLFAAAYELKSEALVLATRVLSDEHNHSNTRQYAILIAGRFGGKDELPMIERLLSDKTSCGTFQANNPPRQVDLQIRDIALAVAVHLTGQNIRDYGFQSAQPNATTLFQVATLIFNDPARREEALKKWGHWRAEHP